MYAEAKNVVVIGASAGGVEALKQLVAKLPGDTDAALFVVLHIPNQGPSRLPEILRYKSRLPVGHAKDGEPMESGRIYVAPPNHHLLLENDHVLLWSGPKENNSRPAINPLFRSAAYNYGEGVVGVLLSGTLDDGSAGLWLIKQKGGIAIVQDPTEAAFSDMPQSALKYVQADYVTGVGGIAEIIVEQSKNAIGHQRVGSGSP